MLTRAIAVTLISAALLTTPVTAEDLRIDLLRHYKGDLYIRCVLDEQAIRKLAQGNPWACAVQTTGIRHSSGAVRLDGRTHLIDDRSLPNWRDRGAEILVFPAR